MLVVSTSMYLFEQEENIEIHVPNNHPLPDMVFVSEEQRSHVCRACEQPVVLRMLTFSKILADALAETYRRSVSETGYATAKDMLKLSRSSYCIYTQLKYWDLIKEGPEDSTWVITELGIEFLRGTLAVPKKLWIFADKVRFFEHPINVVTAFEVDDEPRRSRSDYMRGSIPLEN